MKSRRLAGVPVSEGFAIGRIFCFVPENCTRPCGTIKKEESAHEAARYIAAEARAREELEAHIAAFAQAGTNQAEIFDAHLQLLQDPSLSEEAVRKIQEEQFSCETAVWDTYQEFIDILLETDDPVFRERAADLKDVRDRILRCCAGRPERTLSEITAPVILVAHDLAPSDTACLPRDLVMGIVTEIGGATSHTAILARTAGIPAVLGVPGALEAAENARSLIVDAADGAAIFDPDEAILARYESRLAQWLEEKDRDLQFLSRPGATADGTPIETKLNLGSVADAHSEAAKHADGVGLLRTEFLYMESNGLPDEEHQFRAYAEILEAFQDRPVTLRTLDIGGDKKLPCLALPEEENPFLGLRALRLCLEREDLFVTQLRAAYRASVRGRLQIMFPMVGSLEDFRRAKEVCRKVQAQLAGEGTPFRDDVKLGIMIEVPSIALMADAAARETDFASIGTNDLCQYVCAADRLNAGVSRYYRMTDPGLLRLIAHVAQAYAREGKPVSVCGEMASDPTLARLLIGLGIRSLSMNGASLGAVRRAVSESNLAVLEAAAAEKIH